MEETSRLISKPASTNLYSPQQLMRSHISQHLCHHLLSFLTMATLTEVKWNLKAILIYIFLTIEDIKDFK